MQITKHSQVEVLLSKWNNLVYWLRQNYLYGKDFSVITDHRAILSVLKEHRSNKSYNSRLSRWIDHLLPYNFTIERTTGAKMGLVEYISRNPSAKLFAMLSLAQNIWRPYIDRDILAKASECKSCTEIDEDTIPGRSCLTDAQWADTGMCSDVEIEKVICAANTWAHEEQEKRKMVNGVSCVWKVFRDRFHGASEACK